MIVQIMID